MDIKFTNEASTTISSGINDSVTSIAVVSGAVFPSISGSEYFYATLQSADYATTEIVKVTARSGNTLTVVREQDSTSASAFSSGANCQLRVVAAALTDVGEPTFGVTAGTVTASKAIIVDSNKDITGFRNVTATGTLGVTGETTLASHLNMGDSDIIKLGDGNDLQIYHDGSNSRIEDSGTGSLVFTTNELSFQNGAGDEVIIGGVADGAVTLYHNNAAKIATASTGVTITGEATATGFTGTLDGILGSGAAAAATTTTLDTSGVVNLNLTTDSTSSTSGALIVDGGVGIAKKLFVGTDFDVSGNSVVDGTALVTGVLTSTATQVATGGITSGSDIVSDTDSTDDLGTTSVRWANLFVDAITATDQITATGFTGTLDGILGSGAAAAASVTTLTTSGIASIDDTTDTTSGTTGSIHTDGGVGVAKALYVGTTAKIIGVTTHGDDVVSDTDSTDDLGTTSVRWANLFVDGITATDQITATGFTGTLDGILGSGAAAAAAVTTLDTSDVVNLNLATDSTSSTSGALIVDGGVGVAKKLFVGTDFDVSGNAVIDGTTLMTGVTTHGDDVVSDTDSTDDLGTTGVRWANLFVDAITATDQITATGFTGTLDGILGSGAAAAATTTTLASTSITASGIIKTDDTTQATSTTDGSLQTDGGLSVAKDAVLGNDVTLITDAAVVSMGVNSDVTITHVHDVGIALNDKDIDGVSSINSGPLGGRRNVVFNPNGAVNQRAGTAATTAINTYGPDRWRSYGGALGFSWYTKSDAGEGDGYYMRFHRTASDSQTNATGIAQGLETIDSKHLAGQEITFSFRARAGANWSPSSGRLTAVVQGGEGTDQNPVGMTTAETIIGISADMSTGSSWATFSGSATVPSDKTQIAMTFSFTPTGTAGANDYFDVRNIQLEIGGTATTFEQLPYGEELQRCQRYCTVYTSTAEAASIPHGTAQVDSANRPEVTLHYPQKRVAPSITVTGPTNFKVLTGANTGIACAGFSGALVGTGVHGSVMFFTTSSGVAVNDLSGIIVQLFVFQNTGVITVDSEL